MSLPTQTSLSQAALRDIRELEEKITAFTLGQLPEDRFKAFRLTRGVYGQRQQGVQMFRLKIPYGKITPAQLRTVALLSEQYASGNIHLTTRQNIQLHHVKVADSPRLWEALEGVGLTAREACGNTVRNITASALAGIDPEEPFDVTRHVNAAFSFFLRNPICQDMGRKIKIAFSSSARDSAFTFIHDLGFIPVVRQEDDLTLRGFKVVIGGGLGAQAILAQTYTEFLPEYALIQFIEAVLRVFDRHGEREKRMKARLKFLIKSLGLEEFRRLVEEELRVISERPLLEKGEDFELKKPVREIAMWEGAESHGFAAWKSTNVVAQKQRGYYAAHVRVPLGDIPWQKALELAHFVEEYLGTEFRITVNQGLIIHHVEEEALPILFRFLKQLGFGEPGFGRLTDVTSCPGTDTCNLAVTNSTALSLVLEELIKTKFPFVAHSPQIQIKISGCMNSCGQHMIAGIGFHGSSLKNGERVVPAMQVVLGGGVRPDGTGLIAEKVIKIPSRRIPKAVEALLHDYLVHGEGAYYPDYFQRRGKMYFYNLLKPLASLEGLSAAEFTDWNAEGEYQPEIGVGECAGVSFDLVSAILGDAREKVLSAREYLEASEWSHAVYQSYNVFITSAKALLLGEDIHCNTQVGILRDLDTHLVATGKLELDGSFETLVSQISHYAPTPAFAQYYHRQAQDFLDLAIRFREGAVQEDKRVIHYYYKA
jgi:sulfite reductase (ferredoxin)